MADNKQLTAEEILEKFGLCQTNNWLQSTKEKIIAAMEAYAQSKQGILLSDKKLERNFADWYLDPEQDWVKDHGATFGHAPEEKIWNWIKENILSRYGNSHNGNNEPSTASKEKDYVPSGQSLDEKSLASHSSTKSNSIEQHLERIRQRLHTTEFERLIKEHLKWHPTDLQMASVKYLLESGHISGSLYTAIESIAKQYAAFVIEQPLLNRYKNEQLKSSSCNNIEQELISAQKEYIDFIEKAYNRAHSVAWVHHYRESQEDIDKGKGLREKISELESLLNQ